MDPTTRAHHHACIEAFIAGDYGRAYDEGKRILPTYGDLPFYQALLHATMRLGRCEEARAMAQSMQWAAVDEGIDKVLFDIAVGRLRPNSMHAGIRLQDRAWKFSLYAGLRYNTLGMHRNARRCLRHARKQLPEEAGQGLRIHQRILEAEMYPDRGDMEADMENALSYAKAFAQHDRIQAHIAMKDIGHAARPHGLHHLAGKAFEQAAAIAGSPRRSIQDLDQARRSYVHAFGVQDMTSLRVTCKLMRLHGIKNDWLRVEEVGRFLLAYEERLLPGQVRVAKSNLATAFLETGRPGKARPILEELLDGDEDYEILEELGTIRSWKKQLAHALAESGEAEAAIALLQDIQPNRVMEPHEFAFHQYSLAVAYYRNGQEDHGDACVARAIASLEHLYEPDPKAKHAYLRNLRDNLEEVGCGARTADLFPEMPAPSNNSCRMRRQDADDAGA